MLLGADIVGFIWWLAVRQGTKPVIRNDQWGRAEWALEACLDENPKRRRAGRAVLDLLGRKPPRDQTRLESSRGRGRKNASNGQGTENLPS